MSSTNDSDFASDLHGHRQAERRLPQAPHAGLRGQVEHVVITVPESLCAQVPFDGRQPRREVLLAIGVELDAQERCRVSLDESAAERVERDALTGVVEDELVHDLDG